MTFRRISSSLARRLASASRRTGYVAAILALLWLSLPATVSPTRADDAEVVTVGTWRPTVYPPGSSADYIATVQLYPDVQHRRLFAMGADNGWVAAYNLDTLTPLGAGVATITSGFRTIGIFDGQLGGVYVGSYGGAKTTDSAVEAAVLGPDGNMQHVARQDLSTVIPGDSVIAMYRAPGTNALWLLSEASLSQQSGVAATVGGVGIHITELDTSKFGDPSAVKWTASFPECTRTIHDNASYRTPAGFGYVPEHNALYFGCANSNLNGAYSPPTTRGAARLVLNGDPAKGPTAPPSVGTKLEVYPKDGNFSGAFSAFDPASRRLVMVAEPAAGVPLTSVYVFDARTNSYVGSIAAGGFPVSSIGLDQIAGRMYANGFGIGLVAADIRPTPTNQGRTYPQYGAYKSLRADDSIVAVDPATSRVFLRYNGIPDFVIVQDRIPKYVPPPPANLDANTVDVAEASGRTEAVYASAGQGFGLRARQIGGEYALQVNYTPYSSPTITGPGGFNPPVFPLGIGTREFDGAYLNHLAVTDEEAGASAVAADRDQANTGADMGKHPTWPADPIGIDDWPSRPQFPTGVADPFEPLAPWPYSEAHCLDLGDEPATESQTGAATTCNLKRQKATATASLAPVAVNETFTGSSSLSSSATVDSIEGAISSVTATARNITVLGALHIGEVTATAVTKAKGRPQTTSANYTRVVKDVTVDVNGKTQTLCGSSGCPLDQLAKAINGTFGGRLTIRFPEPLKLSTRGGYAAFVQRNPLEVVEEVLVNEQSPDRLDVPAMVIIVSEDGYRPARTVYELAAVAADSRYGISLTDNGSDDVGTSLDAAADTGLLGDGGIGPLFGAPGEGGGSATERVVVPASRVSPPRFFRNGALRLIWNGLSRARGLLPVWALLVAPMYVWARRWLLLQRSQLISEGEK